MLSLMNEKGHSVSEILLASYQFLKEFRLKKLIASKIEYLTYQIALSLSMHQVNCEVKKWRYTVS